MPRDQNEPTPVDIHITREALAALREGRVEEAAKALRVAQEIQEAAEKNDRGQQEP
jgi:hypothetical protein